ncbi:MAG: hypothetical protein QNK20_13120 [Aureibaculum sp.]|nr:hypothetical protein [Aureibaculum sp.]
MKTTFFKFTVFIFLIGLFINTDSIAQELDASNYRILYKFNTTKQHDNSRLLEVSFIGRNKKDRKDKLPMYDAEIKFYNVFNDNEVLLGRSKTSKEGIAQFILPKDQNYLTDDEGYINLKAVFEGTDAIDEQEEEVRVKNINLELNLTEVDSVKMVLVNAYFLDSLGTKTAVEEADIIISVESMLSNMNIEEGTIEDGEFEFEIPTDIPGDVNGNLTVYATIEDHEEFGNVIQKKTINWGTFNKQIVKEKNTLWSNYAPIWMYVVLSILLGGVWINYIYSIINLIRIRNEGKELELLTENQK